MSLPFHNRSFPDDNFEEGEPGYMMALKLNRRRGNAARKCPVESSLAVPVSDYEPTALLLPPSPPPVKPVALPVKSLINREKKLHPDEPKRPKKPLGPYFLYAAEQRDIQRNKLEGMAAGAVSKFLSDQWKELPEASKAKYVKMAAQAREEHFEAKAKYEKELAAFYVKYPPSEEAEVPFPASASSVAESEVGLFNKVVKLKPQAITEGSDYKYWYVLTFIPDLKWAHLAPMVEVGIFGPDKAKSRGRPKWMLVDESLGKEVDISASFCIPIKARFMKHTLDADKEEWDVIDDGTTPTERKKGGTSRSLKRDEGDSVSKQNESIPRTDNATAIKSFPALNSQINVLLPLVASYPGTSNIVSVKIKGEGLDLKSLGKVMGRPKGSKNRPKVHDSEAVEISEKAKMEKSVVGLDTTIKMGRGRPKTSKNRSNSLDSQAAGSSEKLGAEKSATGFCTTVKKGRSKGPKTPQVDELLPPSKINTKPSRPSLDGLTGRLPCDSLQTPGTRKRGLSRGSAKQSKPDSLSKISSDCADQQEATSRKRKRADAKSEGSHSRSRRSAAPAFLGKAPDRAADQNEEPSGNRIRTDTKSENIPSRPRRSAAPTFLGEALDPVVSELDKIPYSSRRSSIPNNSDGRRKPSSPLTSPGSSSNAQSRRRVSCPDTLDPPRSTTKRWHPVRETRNGKVTPRARRNRSPSPGQRMSVSPKRGPARECKIKAAPMPPSPVF
jgi:hypothetical protein